ncbi:cytochrome-c oxidase, cbb3-type subunit II [Jannaschia ovalis]|uniref:Cytochrome-c oxidase, cbb3-type subunit II n=1 Tax=Jannaschia ovalis TaxID=3038773 RepID=A0ABY8L9N5_9RHOB|nr:cytochrome-c oxidase, cbb3-type subunit II [Jannaschia sp. GRR-S6-38]WGH78067.1 cytochrome-c oxidase, cbb3-type subunit II [Jannaschia sp. GRR-S6-38]
MTKDPRDPNYDPKDDPKVVTAGEGAKEGKLPNELPPETETITFHQRLERNATLLLVASFLVVTVGGVVEIAPLFYLENTIEKVEGMRPYSPLELEGRNIYIREGCYVCHSQMIRPMRDEVERYGHYSLAAESMYDHPFQWGSKRTGPDLARVGGRYSDEWHVDHLMDPQSVVPESVMPKYAFLADTPLDGAYIGEEMAVHRFVGVPYDDEMIAEARADFLAQADPDSDWDALVERYPGAQVRNFDGLDAVTEMDALIAYLQMLGTLVDFSTFTPVASR